MAKAIKLKNNIYLDSTSIVYNKQKLSYVLGNYIITQNFAKNIQLNSNTTGTVSINVEKNNYTAMGIVSVNSNNNQLTLQKFSVYANKMAYVTFKNVSTAAITADVDIQVLYLLNL